MANDYDALIAGETKQNLRASIAQTNGVAPDAEAEIRRLGRVYQLPTSTVRNNLPEVQKRATADSFDYDTLVARSPRTANYLAEPENAKIAHDDVDSLSGIEQFIQNLGGLAKASGLGLVEGVVGANQALNSVLDPLGWAVGPGSKSYAGADVYRKAARKRTEQFMPVTTNAWEAGVNAGVVSLFQQAPMMAAAVALRNPELALGGMGATVGGQSYGEAKDAGKGTGEALAFGVNQAAIEVLTERLPVGALVGDIAKGTGILQTLAKQLVLDVPGEQLATAFQDLNEWATLNPEKPFSEYLAERPNAALQTLVASVVGSGGMVTVGKIAGAAAGLDRKREQAQGATAQADALAQMEKLAAASKLRERDPQSFQDFIAAATEDGPVSDVYVSAEGLKQSGVDLEALAATVPAVASQLQDAIASGGDVRIPVDEFATFLAGDSMAKALLPHLATEAGGFSQTSAEEYMATQTTALQAEVEGVLSKSTEREAFQASTEKVQTYFLEQLNTAKRFTPDVNSAYATMMGSFYAVNAERLGITPEEMLVRYPLQIRAEGVMGDALDQSAQDRAALLLGEFTKRAQRERNSPKYVREAIQRETEQAENFAKRAQDYRDRPPVASTYTADELQQRSETHALQADVWRQVERNLKPAKPTPVGQAEPTEGSAPDVDWFGRDLRDAGDVSEASIVKDYGNGKGVAYQAYIPAEQFPDESLVEEQEDEDPDGYDWTELRSRGTPPPAKVVIKPDGEMYVSDGNHRTRFWREAGFDYLPAWVIDQRKGATTTRADGFDQKARGQFSPATSTITLLKNADLSTFLHESGHFYLETLADMASQPDAPAEIAADLEAVLKWFGTMNAPKASGSGPLNQPAFHGSPHVFDKFTTSAIGTGEGAQAYGWGLYFAGRKEIAQHHRDVLAGDGFLTSEGKVWDPSTLEHMNVRTAARKGDLDAALERAKGLLGTAPDATRDLLVRDIAVLEGLIASGGVRANAGRLYEVDIPEDNEYLLWDRPLSEQPEAVRAALEAAAATQDVTLQDIAEIIFTDGDVGKLTGERVYDKLVDFGDQESASKALHEAGIAGIKYLDGTSRTAGEGSYNYVVFDESRVSIKSFEQNGDQGAPGEGPMTLERWRSTTLDEQRYYHEAFARGFEGFAFEGKVSNPALRGVFQRFAAWMRSIYREITRLNVDLTDDVRGVFDRMLSSAEHIEAQAQADGMTPMFTSIEDAAASGVVFTEDAWADHQAQATAAMAEGMDQLQTRSLRDMKWLSGAKDKVIRRLQREAADARKAIRAEVTEEVMAEPINRARTFLKRGIGADGQPVEGPHKLSLPALRLANEGVPEELQDYKRLGYGRYGMLAEEGLDPDLVAESFGLPSGEALVEALLNAEPAAEKIAGMTDQRMLERYGDLTDDDAIERAADQALHNSARLKFVATEANALAVAAGRPRILARAAKDYAAAMVGRLRVKDVKPYRYRAAETRAAQAAEKARRAGDLVTATVEKRNQLINAHATRAAYDTQAEIDKALNAWRRIVTGNDEAMARNRDMDLVNAARAVLAVYGVGRKKNDVQGYIDTLKRLNPSLYADIEPFLTRAAVNGAAWQDITVEEFMGLRDTVAQLWFLSKRNRQMEVDGQLVDRKAVAAELSAKLDERGVPDVRPGETEDVTDGQRVLRALSGFRAAARRVESWVRKIDAADTGPFRKYLWQLISETADAYLLAQRDYLQRFLALTQALGPIKAVKIAAPEIGYTFADKGRLLHAILHTGNESNKRKLLLGRGWASETAEGMLDTQRWDAMVARMVAEGKLTKADYDFAQGVWDLLDETKEGAQRAHRAVYGRYFEEVTADRFETPFGSYRGGYVPALTDQFLVQDAALRAQQDALTEGDAQMFPSPAKGFTKSRVDYNKQLALDLRLLPQHIDKVLKFTYFAAPSQDAVRLLKEKGLSAKLEAYDPVAQTDLLLPWLNRAAKQIVETPMPMGAAGKAAGTFFRAVRQRTGMGIMFANLSNSLQQLTGFSVSAVRVKPSLLASALVQYVQNPKEMTEAIRAVSPFMVGRGDSQVFEMRQTIDDLLLDPTTFKTAQQFAARHGYFMQTAFQNLVDNVTWKGAHEQAIAQGETETQAVRFANSVVRETQGGMRPEDIARFETGNAFVRLFTQFAGFFNMMANLQGTEFSITAQTMGLRKGAGRMFYVYAMGFAVPAVLSEIIVQSMKGSLGDDDGDGYLDDFLDMFFGSQVRFGLAMVPVAGQVAATGLNFFNDKRYDDRLSTPTISAVESAVKAPNSIYKAIAEDGDKSTALKDTLSLMTLLTGIPFTILGRPGGYMVDVAEGDVAPAGPVDAVRGLVTGAASPQSRE